VHSYKDAVGLALAAAALFVAVPSVVAAPGHCWRRPVAAAVVDDFREPACRWCPGNRGLEYGTAAGDQVSAVATGVVVFSGSVAGTRYVVVELADGLRITYGNLTGPLPTTDAVVVAGSVVGSAAGHLHFGVREGDRYVDPAPMIGELRGVPRLIPVDGTPRLPAPPPMLTCAATAT